MIGHLGSMMLWGALIWLAVFVLIGVVKARRDREDRP